jgi:hypothetical protein
VSDGLYNIIYDVYAQRDGNHKTCYVHLLATVIIYKNHNLLHGSQSYQILNLSCYNYCKYNCQYGKYLLLISTITQYILQANKPTLITDTALLPQNLVRMKV